jgi:hypothetical protein
VAASSRRVARHWYVVPVSTAIRSKTQIPLRNRIVERHIGNVLSATVWSRPAASRSRSRRLFRSFNNENVESSVPVPEDGSVAAPVPFTMTGTLGGFLLGSSEPRFQVALTGAGSMWVSRHHAGDPFISFGFIPQAAPIPEPATLFLLSAGVAVVALRRRAARGG